MCIRDAEADVYVSGKTSRMNPGRTLKMGIVSGREVCGMRGVAEKCIDITQNSDCEGSIPALN